MGNDPSLSVCSVSQRASSLYDVVVTNAGTDSSGTLVMATSLRDKRTDCDRFDSLSSTFFQIVEDEGIVQKLSTSTSVPKSWQLLQSALQSNCWIDRSGEDQTASFFSVTLMLYSISPYSPLLNGLSFPVPFPFLLSPCLQICHWQVVVMSRLLFSTYKLLFAIADVQITGEFQRLNLSMCVHCLGTAGSRCKYAVMSFETLKMKNCSLGIGNGWDIVLNLLFPSFPHLPVYCAPFKCKCWVLSHMQMLIPGKQKPSKIELSFASHHSCSRPILNSFCLSIWNFLSSSSTLNR